MVELPFVDRRKPKYKVFAKETSLMLHLMEKIVFAAEEITEASRSEEDTVDFVKSRIKTLEDLVRASKGLASKELS